MAKRLVIVGASIAGLGAALALSRAGFEVTVYETDPAPPTGAPHELFASWQRPGVAQLRHSHGFLARLRNLLRDRYPDLLTALRAAGAQERRFGDSLPPVLAAAYTPHPEDDDLTALLCRRTTFEGVLYHYVKAQPRVQFQTGCQVTGVLLEAGSVAPRLTGLTLRDADTPMQLSTDIVIDATGRRSPFPAWLRTLGIAVEEETEPTGIIYYTRFYRLQPGQTEPERTDHSSMGDLGYLKFGVFPADHQTFSLTLAIPTVETDLRILRHNEAFTLVCNALPGLAPWLHPSRAIPTSDVFAMGGLHNGYRHFVRRDQPVVLGYFAVGEAALHTNPLYGRGCSLSFLHAHVLADILRTVSDPAARARQYDRVTRSQLRPFYDVAVRRDRVGLQRARAESQAQHRHRWHARLIQSFVQHGLAPAMRGDLEVRRAFLRDFHMLELPGLALRRPELLLRILRFWIRGQRQNANLYPPRPGPTRDEMRRLLGLAIP
jgi:2-polyprenyl-6-methoxyphenol hydroxylase-like FAD-dependent oxidoreductase